jgi:hypothetical protein
MSFPADQAAFFHRLTIEAHRRADCAVRDDGAIVLTLAGGDAVAIKLAEPGEVVFTRGTGEAKAFRAPTIDALARKIARQPAAAVPEPAAAPKAKKVA